LLWWERNFTKKKEEIQGNKGGGRDDLPERTKRYVKRTWEKEKGNAQQTGDRGGGSEDAQSKSLSKGEKGYYRIKLPE